MFPSNSTSQSHHNPFSYSDHSFDFQTNPPSKEESDDQLTNLSFFHFPSSPFEDYQFLLNQQPPHDFPELEQLPNQHDPQQVMMNMNMEGEINQQEPQQVTRKRPGKRDKQCKINTARGLRDRRMRLSLHVAKRLFHLQDMLGFEKASKTVEWLLNQAKEEIKQVAAKTTSSTFDCELGLSSSPEEIVLNENQEEEKKLKGLKRRTKVRPRKISAFHHPLAKVSRKKARERARERTKEKMRSKQWEIETTNHSLTIQLGSSNL